MFLEGPGENFAAGVFDRRDHLGRAVEFLVQGVLHRQLLVDQTTQHLASCAGCLGLGEPLEVGDYVIDLVHGDLVAVDLGSNLAAAVFSGLAVLAAAGQDQRRDDDESRGRRSDPTGERSDEGHRTSCAKPSAPIGQ
jgi:hypothetical protein